MTSATLDQYSDIPTLKEEQLDVSARHAKSSPISMFIVVGIIANIIRAYSDHYEWAFWLGAVSLLLFLRFIVFNYLFERFEVSVDQRVRIALWLSVVHGSIHASALLFFPQFSEVERALISLILAGFCLQATATGGDIRQFLCFSLPIMPTIAIMWTTGGTFTLQTPEATLLGLSIAMFYVQQIYIARSNDEKALSSHEARTELASLNHQLQSAVQRADVANRAKTRFLASASHDLRQPIHALSLFSAALIRLTLPNQAKEVASHINQSVTVLANQLDALLDVSKLDAGIVQPKVEPVSIHDFLNRISREYETEVHDKGLQLNCKLQSNSNVSTDILLFERIIRNLMNNAVRYTSTGSISIESRDTASHCQIVITDTGPGINPHEQGRIFDEFYQVDSQADGQGLGLGLSIVSRLTRLLDIKLDLQSELDTGTTFTLTLANISSAPALAAPHQTSDAYSLANKTILVVDDEAAIRRGMDELLGIYQANVLSAASAEEAEQLARTHSIDLLITDLGLGSDDGLTLATEICATTGQSSLPVILITGDTDSAKLQEAHASNFVLMHKPVDTDELLTRVQQLVNSNI